MSHQKGYVDPDYLDMAARVVAGYKDRTYQLMRTQPGDAVLDVGCGPGTDTIPLAHSVGPTGRVVGVDFDETMVSEAEARARDAGVSDRVQHRQADATALPFDDDTFDSARSERLFQHLRDPEAALREMFRVTKSGGAVVVLDTDWSTLSVDTRELDIERRLLQYRLDRFVHNPYAGRQLYRLFRMQARDDVSYEMCPIGVTNYAIGRQGALLDELERAALEAGVVTDEEIARWRADLEDRDARGVFFASVMQVLVAGRKP